MSNELDSCLTAEELASLEDDAVDCRNDRLWNLLHPRGNCVAVQISSLPRSIQRRLLQMRRQQQPLFVAD